MKFAIIKQIISCQECDWVYYPPFIVEYINIKNLDDCGELRKRALDLIDELCYEDYKEAQECGIETAYEEWKLRWTEMWVETTDDIETSISCQAYCLTCFQIGCIKLKAAKRRINLYVTSVPEGN